MPALPEPVSSEDEIIIQSAASLEPSASFAQDAPHDLYAENELHTRHERTERMIQKAREQA